ncbi:MAG: tetratricopeptide repeat protein [Polyangiaceae bacterium]
MTGKRRTLGSWAALAVCLIATNALGGEELREAAKKPPKDPEAAFELGRSLRRAGEFDDALRVLRGAALKAKGELAVRARLEAARTLISANRQKDALRECQGIKPLDAVKWDVCVAESHLLWKRASLALPAAERALEAAAGDYDALVAKGRALRMMGKSAESEAAFQSAIAKSAGRFQAHLYLAELYSGLGKQSDAVAALRKAVAADPDEPTPMLVLAEALPASAEASDLLEKALKIRPKFGAALARKGELLLEQGKVAEAEAAYRAAVATDAKMADWQAGLARALVAKGTFDEALKVASVALKLVSNHALAKLAEADAIAGKGDIDLAIEAYEKAASFSRENPWPLVNAARACLGGNRPTTARAFADRAVQSFPEFAPAWLALGDVAVAGKDKSAAKNAYQKALTAPKGNVDKAAVKKKLAALK